MAKNKGLIFFLLVISFFQVKAQYRFIYFKDKKASNYTLSNPHEFLSEKAITRRINQGIALTEKDLPVSTAYIEQVAAQGAKVIYSSKWLNGLLIDANDEIFNKVKTLDFVRNDKDISFLRKKTGLLRTHKTANTKAFESEKMNYGSSLYQNQMLGIDSMHSDGYHGEGMTIAVLDAGFYNINKISLFDSLFNNHQILSTYDFVNKESSVYEDNSHGMQVLSILAGYQNGSLIGGAYKADYVLLKTEDVNRESKLEEIYWTLGAEYADSIGADILTSSLGYNTFDNPNDNYTYEDLNGNTALITLAADYAAYTGMVVIVSMGNEGNDTWRTLTVPADGDSVLSVGAVDGKGAYATFSSRGNTADNRIKPDVMALGVGTVVSSSSGNVSTNNGTSFSAPLIAGLAAGLWQANPTLSNMELLDIIKRSGSNALTPDSLMGYGIPKYGIAKKLIVTGIDNFFKGETIVYPNPLNETALVIKDSNFINYENVKVYLYNSNNELLINSKLKVKNNQITIDSSYLSTLFRGTYYIRLISEKQKTIKKLIKL